jgi:hypothetical protein
MTHWIEAMCEPTQLILAWQPSDLDAALRWRWAVGLLTPVDDGIELRYFEPGAEFESYNSGKRFEDLLALGYVGYPAFSMTTPVHREGVKQALMRRFPPRSRSDFGGYAAQFRLRDTDELSDFALLARTEAKVPSDGFSVVDTLDPMAQRCDLLVEIAGYRHYMKDIAPIQLGDEVQIVAEPENEHDGNAVATLVDGTKIGNINRLQAATFLAWLKKHEVHAVVERINGTAERPRVFLFVRVRPVGLQAAA